MPNLLPHRRGSALLALAALVSLTAPAAAQGSGRVLVLGADETGFTNDVQSKLASSGMFQAVDSIDARSNTPSLAQLGTYDAVLTWSDYDYQNFTALGDNLADYVDAGGGVVVAVFANSETLITRTLGGRWATGGYSIIGPMAGFQSGGSLPDRMLGTVALPNHPVMTNVTLFDGGSSAFRPVSTVLPAGTQLIASWGDGSILAAEHATRVNRVDLGMFPPSSDASLPFWVSGTDGARLMANALAYAGQVGSSTTFCSGDGSGTACPCGNAGAAKNGCASSTSAVGAHLGTTGFPTLSADSLKLRGSSMPDSFALYFQGTMQLNGGAGFVFGDGLRCAGGVIVRLGAKLNVAGASEFPAAGDPAVSVQGTVTAPGLRTYQVWYRNADPTFCTPATFNLTNGVEVTWNP